MPRTIPVFSMIMRHTCSALILSLLASAFLTQTPLRAQNAEEGAASFQSVSEMTKAAETGNPLAAYELGNAYLLGRGVAANPAQAIKWFQNAAYQGRVDAAYELASLMEDGKGTPKDVGGALFWNNKAAEGGVVAAMAALGRLYADDQSPFADIGQALRWRRAAASKNDMESLLALAAFYQTPKGSFIDEEEAVNALSLAARLGSDEAAFRLAQLYLSKKGKTAIGYGPGPETRIAIQWLGLATARYYAPALHQMATFRISGVDARMNLFRGLIELEQAADQGYAPSLALLGNIYAKGRIVAVDPVRAWGLLSAAVEAGDKEAQEEAQALAKNMSTAQQQSARRYLRDWKAQR